MTVRGVPGAGERPRLPAWRRAALKLLRVEVHYRDETMRALETGRVVLLSDHRAVGLEGIVLALASPVDLTFAVTARHALRHPLTSRGIRLLVALGLGHVVALDSDRPMALRALARVLEADRPVMIFPEGRVRPPAPPPGEQPGWSWLVRRTGARAIRVSFTGVENVWPLAPRGRRIRPPITLTL